MRSICCERKGQSGEPFNRNLKHAEEMSSGSKTGENKAAGST